MTYRLDIAAAIGVVLHSHLSEGLFDIVRRRVWLHFEQIVVLLIDRISSASHIPSITAKAIEKGPRERVLRLLKEDG